MANASRKSVVLCDFGLLEEELKNCTLLRKIKMMEELLRLSLTLNVMNTFQGRPGPSSPQRHCHVAHEPSHHPSHDTSAFTTSHFPHPPSFTQPIAPYSLHLYPIPSPAVNPQAPNCIQTWPQPASAAPSTTPPNPTTKMPSNTVWMNKACTISIHSPFPSTNALLHPLREPPTNPPRPNPPHIHPLRPRHLFHTPLHAPSLRAPTRSRTPTHPAAPPL
jgi:hypothetical protein